MAFVLLNPSTGGDDPTIRRCIGGLEAVNLYADRATNPARWLPGGTNNPDATAALGYGTGSKAAIAVVLVRCSMSGCGRTATI